MASHEPLLAVVGVKEISDPDFGEPGPGTDPLRAHFKLNETLREIQAAQVLRIAIF